MIRLPYDFVAKAGDVLKDIYCPECGSHLVVRKNKKTKDFFIGCGSFPECIFASSYEIESLSVRR